MSQLFFIGEHKHIVDPKGRVIIPAKFRNALGDKIVVTKGYNRCLFVYSLEEWTKMAAKLSSLPFTDENVRKFVRVVASGASDCDIDKQSRILIPANLRAYANLDKDIVIIGAMKWIEIWNSELWAQYNSNVDIDDPTVIERMVELGI